MVLNRLDSVNSYSNAVVQKQEKENIQPQTTTVKADVKVKNTDLDAPVEGYYVEQTSQEPIKAQGEEQNNQEDDDDDIDMNVDPDEKITILPSIAINKTATELTNTMEQAVNRAVADILSSTSDASFYRAQAMVSDQKSYKCFDELNFKNNFNIYGKTVFEGNYQNYNNDSQTDIKLSQNSEKADLGLSYKSKSGKTKAFFFGSYTHTNCDVELKSEASDNESEDTVNNLSGNVKFDSYSVYGAVQRRFNNGDIITGSAFRTDDAASSVKTNSFDASYYAKRFMTMLEGKTTIQKLGNLNTVTKTDFTISFNPELAVEQKQKNSAPDNTSETQTNTDEEEKTTGKKITKTFTPFFNTQAISGDTETGLGLKYIIKRTDKNSGLKFASFGKLSTTQQQESSKYHLTFGSGIKYTNNIGAKSHLKAEAEIKDRYTFGDDNILTASAHVVYASPKFCAEAEAKRILISGDQPSYAAFDLRSYYIPSDSINLFGELSHVYLKEPDNRLNGTNFQVGIIANF